MTAIAAVAEYQNTGVVAQVKTRELVEEEEENADVRVRKGLTERRVIRGKGAAAAAATAATAGTKRAVLAERRMHELSALHSALALASAATASEQAGRKGRSQRRRDTEADARREAIAALVQALGGPAAQRGARMLAGFLRSNLRENQENAILAQRHKVLQDQLNQTLANLTRIHASLKHRLMVSNNVLDRGARDNEIAPPRSIESLFDQHVSQPPPHLASNATPSHTYFGGIDLRDADNVLTPIDSSTVFDPSAGRSSLPVSVPISRASTSVMDEDGDSDSDDFDDPDLMILPLSNRGFLSANASSGPASTADDMDDEIETNDRNDDADAVELQEEDAGIGADFLLDPFGGNHMSGGENNGTSGSVDLFDGVMDLDFSSFGGPAMGMGLGMGGGTQSGTGDGGDALFMDTWNASSNSSVSANAIGAEPEKEIEEKPEPSRVLDLDDF
ncbi:hypothetical protein BC830DRAFT_1220694 [Chytriomyces sp. MP71]|nr:hypothetical protein BC830DRAFT_1220694 [Chytriomyces sp. MP71]